MWNSLVKSIKNAISDNGKSGIRVGKKNSWVNLKKGFKLIHSELRADDWHAKCQTDLWEQTDLEQERLANKKEREGGEEKANDVTH